MPAIVFATALPSRSGPSTVARRRDEHRCTRTRGAGRDERRDRVRRVVNTVGERECQRHPHRSNKPCAHPQILVQLKNDGHRARVLDVTGVDLGAPSDDPPPAVLIDCRP